MVDSQNPNLYLVGFMGTGKSAIGRAVAERLGMGFLDSDREIEKAQGRPISAIFAAEGEGFFRQLEERFVREGHPERGQVVACGGGLITTPGLLDILEERGVVVALYASPETIHERTRENAKRPLLAVEDPVSRIRELLAVREAVYRRVELAVSTETQPFIQTVAKVIRLYRSHARLLD